MANPNRFEERDGRFYAGVDATSEITRAQYIEAGMRPSDITQEEVEYMRSVQEWTDGFQKLDKLEKQRGLPPGSLVNQMDVKPVYPGGPAPTAPAATAPAPDIPTTADIPGATDYTSKTLQELMDAAAPATQAGLTPLTVGRPRTATSNRPAPAQLSTFNSPGLPAPTAPPQTPSEEAAEEAPELDRTRIDPLLSNVNQATSGLLGIANNRDEYSAAQAQLALGLAQAQRSNLSLARSGNRRDSAALSARALQTNAEQSAEATRSAALLRAQEEEANKRLRVDAYKAAGELGLNASALEVDISRLNMESVTNYLNQLFDTKRLGMQLNQQEAERITNFIRDMALIAKDYYALDVQERIAVMDDLTRRHGIDQNLVGIMKQLDAQPGFWENAALGAISAGAQVGGALALKSDRRAKDDVADATEAELEALLEAVGAKTFKYKKPGRDGEGSNFGVMAQDLRKTKFGKSLTFDDKDGEISVHGGKAGLAALAGLSMVYEKLKELEEAL